MKIQVTQEDIDNGFRGFCSACPIALAIGGALEVERVAVTDNTVIVDRKSYSLPYSAVLFISNFDNQNPVEPFEFEVEGL